MYRIHQQAKARQDLKNIWLYTYENFGVDQADKYFDELESAMETIQIKPFRRIATRYGKRAAHFAAMFAWKSGTRCRTIAAN